MSNCPDCGAELCEACHARARRESDLITRGLRVVGVGFTAGFVLPVELTEPAIVLPGEDVTLKTTRAGTLTRVRISLVGGPFLCEAEFNQGAFAVTPDDLTSFQLGGLPSLLKLLPQ